MWVYFDPVCNLHKISSSNLKLKCEISKQLLNNNFNYQILLHFIQVEFLKFKYIQNTFDFVAFQDNAKLSYSSIKLANNK